MTHTVTKANTRSLVSFILKQNDKPVYLSGLTVKVFGKTDVYATWFAERTTGVAAEPLYTFTADATTKLITHARHHVKEGDQIRVSNSGGALPTGLAASTDYFAVQVTDNAFGLAATPGGASVIAGAGTPINSYFIVGEVTVDWQTADVAATGMYRLYFNVYDGSEYDTFPVAQDGTHNPGFIINVVEPA